MKIKNIPCTTAQLHNCTTANKITSYFAFIVTAIALLFAANLQAQQYPAKEGYAFEDDLYFYKWRTLEYPPLPDVKINGEWFTWEDVYGSLPPQPPTLIKRPKNPPLKKEVVDLDNPSSIRKFLKKSIKGRKIQKITISDFNESIESDNKLHKLKYFSSYTSNSEKQENKNKSTSSFSNQENVISSTVMRTSSSTYQGLSASTNLIINYFDKFEYPSNSVTSIPFTDYVLGIENVPQGSDADLFFKEDISSSYWRLIPWTGYYDVPVNNEIIRLPAWTAEGLHEKGFFCASLRLDSDNDGISDAAEVLVFKSDPNNADSSFLCDANGDGIPDFTGKADNWICDGDEDLDGDGWTNAQELTMGTNPFIAQDNSLDTDGDILPDWVETLLYVHLFVSDSGIQDNLDGDWANNYTELALGTNPAARDADMYVKGDLDTFFFGQATNRVFNLGPIVVRHASPINSMIPSGMMFESCGLWGSFIHLDILRNALTIEGEDYDEIHISGAYLTPQSWWTDIDLTVNRGILISAPVLREGLTSTSSLLGSMTGILGNVWYEPGVANAVNSLSQDAAGVVAIRSIGRISILMRRLQLLGTDLTINFQNQPPEMQKKICTLVSGMISEANLYNRTITRYIEPNSGIPIGTLVGRVLILGNAVCTIANALNLPASFEEDLDDYLSAVMSRDDPSGLITKAFTATLTNYLINVVPTYPTNLYMILLDALSDFQGYHTD
jgi:hypothetical protein